MKTILIDESETSVIPILQNYGFSIDDINNAIPKTGHYGVVIVNGYFNESELGNIEVKDIEFQFTGYSESKERATLDGVKKSLKFIEENEKAIIYIDNQPILKYIEKDKDLSKYLNENKNIEIKWVNRNKVRLADKVVGDVNKYFNEILESLNKLYTSRFMAGTFIEKEMELKESKLKELKSINCSLYERLNRLSMITLENKLDEIEGLKHALSGYVTQNSKLKDEINDLKKAILKKA